MENRLFPKISVIVPVYKAEAYLCRCVDSLLAQTFLDFEVLLVDDGSPDRSGEICDEYARKDRRVRVFHKENGGVSSARQCGMDHAQGEYTIHADPDDWVEPTMLEELYKKAKEEDADMVICDFYEERKNKTIYIRQQPSSLDHETVLCELFQQLHGSCWNKLVRRACYKEFGVRFPEELSYREDLFTNACLTSHQIKVVYLPKGFYHYDTYINQNSMVRQPSGLIHSQEQVLHQLLKEKLPEAYFHQIVIFLLSAEVYRKIIEKSYSKNFKSEYIVVKYRLWESHLSFIQKLLIKEAFIFSPLIAYFTYRIIHTVKMHVINQYTSISL